jgi:parallel beta-helix repeat protein
MRKTLTVLIAWTICLNAFTFLFPIQTCIASGDTIYVNPGESIQDAINAANESDTVYVYSGTYYENVTITKNLTLEGENKETTIIDGGKNGHVVHVYGSSGNEITFSITGFKLTNAGGTGNDCIAMSYVTNGNINNNIIMNSDQSDGIQLDHCNEITISGNTITNNKENGINLILTTDSTIGNNNQIQSNQKGIRLYLSSNNNVIYDNTITGNTQYGIHVIQSSNNRIYLNRFTNNGQNAYDSYTNDWDYNSQGNYWDDYSGVDENPEDGIGDTPYDISGGSNKDNFPLGYFAGEPVAYIDSISPNPATEGETVSFNGHGTDEGTIVSWEWKSNKDGVLSNSEDFQSSSLSVGTHAIEFRVKDDDGGWSDPDTDTLVISSQSEPENQKPTAEVKSITPSTSTEGDQIYFHGIGQDSDGIVTEYNWRSNIDGILSSESTFSRSDLSAGIHIIYFKVKDNDGEWSDEDSKNIIIDPSLNDPPVADIDGPYTGYTNVTISFDASGSSDPDGDEIVSYIWDFGDGTNATGMTVEHNYNSTGNYTVKLTLTDSQSKSSTISTYANISIQPSSQNGDGGTIGIPGFEIIFMLVAIVFVLLWKRKRYE